ncbi:MAG: erg24, C-14 sterol reductase [Candelina mexicana]|nr:MAG: erg24, C-14 sterol reductase [Candelina mexicana]
MSTSKSNRAVPQTTHTYEFGGPLGTSALTILLPLVCYLVTFLCNDVSGCPVPSLLHPSTLSFEQLKRDAGWPSAGILGLFNISVAISVLDYYALSLVLQALLPGKEVEGVELRSGGRLKYKFNAFNSALFVLSAAFVGTLVQGSNFFLWTYIWDNYTAILTTNIVIAFALATFVYVRSFTVKRGNLEHRELAAGGYSGNLVYDWFIGRELNPRIEIPAIGTIDIKAFCELRPGMLGWILLDLAFVAHQYKVHGFVSDSMILITLFQSIYVFDALWMEAAILTTMDITTDGFGFMLAFGDLAWLPFIYSLQARYLAVYPVQLGFLGTLGVLAVQGFGYYVFRGANNEKNRFRTNPDDPRVSHLQYIQTKTGSKLLTSRWWGTARHINYLGDWIMAWSYCLPTGIAGYLIQRSGPGSSLIGASPADGSIFGGAPVGTKVVQGEARGWGMLITYFYVIYFAILLIHREMRDEEKCMKKYGKDWEEYKRKVPWRILPGIY